jgi:hypothetical protein
MFPRRFRIVDLVGLVGLAAIVATILRDDGPYTRSDPTFVACPLVVSPTLAALLWAVIAARFGREDHRAWWWGFALVAGTYFALGLDYWSDYRFRPFPSRLFVEALAAVGQAANRSGWASVGDFAQFLCCSPVPKYLG